MPGEPAETMIGVGAIGFGLLLGVAAYKNKSPVAIIRAAVTTGSIDLSKIPDLIPSPDIAMWHAPPAVDTAIADIAKKDPALAVAIKAELSTFDSFTPYSKTTKFFNLMSQARVEGFAAQAQTIEDYVNQLVTPASTAASPTGTIPV